MTRFEKVILSITGGSHLSVHALMLALPSLIPVIRNEFNVGLDGRGFVVTGSGVMVGLEMKLVDIPEMDYLVTDRDE